MIEENNKDPLPDVVPVGMVSRSRYNFLILVNALLVSLILAAAVVLRPWHPPPALPHVPFPTESPVAEVNGETVPYEEFERATRVLHGPRVLQSLVDEALIEQQAKAQGVTLDDTQQRVLSTYLGGVQTEMTEVQGRELRAQFLAQNLLLKGISEARLHQVYDLYRDDLTEYKLWYVALPDEGRASAFVHAMADGVSFEAATRRYAVDAFEDTSGMLGYLSAAEIRNRFGADVLAAVRRLAPGEMSLPIHKPLGVEIVKLAAIRASYQELRPAVQAMIATAGHNMLLYRLRRAADIRSPFLIVGKLTGPSKGVSSPAPVQSASPVTEQSTARPARP